MTLRPLDTRLLERSRAKRNATRTPKRRLPAERELRREVRFRLLFILAFVLMAAVILAVAPAKAQESEAEADAMDVSVTYTGDVWINTRGGLDQGARYLDNLDLIVTLDAERALGLPGVTLHGHGLYNNGQPFSADLVGDLQAVSNIETGIRAVRLYEAWAEVRFAGDKASLKLGLYDLNSEFDAIDTAALFLNSSHGIGADLAQTGQNGPSIFPVTSLGLRGDHVFADGWMIKAAILDAVPGDPTAPAHTAIRLDADEGALLVAEVSRDADGGRAALGVWRYTKDFDTFPTVASARRTKNTGWYVFVEHRLSVEEDRDQGLSGWLRIGAAEAAINPIARYVGGGLVYTGPIPGRDQDQAGLAFAWAQLGRAYRSAVQVEEGLRLSGSEMVLEATYRAPLNDRLTFQPNLQFVINPGGRPDIGDALVIGFRTELGF